MEFGFVLNAIIDISYIIMFILANVAIHFGILTSRKSEIAIKTIIIIYLCLIMWGYIGQYLSICLLSFAISYINYLIVVKKELARRIYIVYLILFSAFFILWITILFGKYYYVARLIDINLYEDEINRIYTLDYFFTIEDLLLSIIYFSIGVDFYFITPEIISFSDVRFVQYVIGIIINGTIVLEIFDLIKRIISPNNR